MKMKLMDFFFGICILKVEGIFPERVINIAKSMGIFIQNIQKTDNGALFFTVSRQGAEKLLAYSFPPEITLTLSAQKGLIAFFHKNKGRYALFICPVIAIVLLFFSTNIIWHVNIVGDDPIMEERLLKELEAVGVKRGVLKFKIDQKKVKNELLVSNSDLSWIWVDLKGASAIVKYALRSPTPQLLDEDAFYNIYSASDSVITRIVATRGTPRVCVGETVLKGQLLIEGTAKQKDEAFKQLHALGEVYGLVWEEKTYKIPKKTEIRTPTGQKQEQLSINFEKFIVKLFINSSILYSKYDIIEYNRDIPFLPVTFTKREYVQVDVTYRENDTDSIAQKHTEEFCSQLTKKGFTINDITVATSDMGDSVKYTVRVLCEEPIAVERRINIGENNSVPNS